MQYFFEPVHEPRVAYLVEADSLKDARKRLRFAVGQGERTLALSPLESLEEAQGEGVEVYQIGKRGVITRIEEGGEPAWGE